MRSSLKEKSTNKWLEQQKGAVAFREFFLSATAPFFAADCIRVQVSDTAAVSVLHPFSQMIHKTGFTDCQGLKNVKAEWFQIYGLANTGEYIRCFLGDVY